MSGNTKFDNDIDKLTHISRNEINNNSNTNGDGNSPDTSSSSEAESMFNFRRDIGTNTTGYTYEDWGIDPRHKFPLTPRGSLQPHARILADMLEHDRKVNGRSTVKGRSFANLDHSARIYYIRSRRYYSNANPLNYRTNFNRVNGGQTSITQNNKNLRNHLRSLN